MLWGAEKLAPAEYWCPYGTISWKPERHLSCTMDVPFRTIRALTPYTLYSDCTLLVLKETSLTSIYALLALNWPYLVEKVWSSFHAHLVSAWLWWRSWMKWPAHSGYSTVWSFGLWWPPTSLARSLLVAIPAQLVRPSLDFRASRISLAMWLPRVSLALQPQVHLAISLPDMKE